MKQQYAQEWPQFFTATIQEWKHLLKEDKYKNIIVETLKFLVTENNVTINGFVIMPNHIHIIWQAKANNDLQKIQLLAIDNNLQAYEVNAIDRKYNFW
jgi:REP element-mobilizing transposase RayT